MTELFTVSCFHTVPQSFPPLSPSHPLILPLCLCEEACLPAGTGGSDARPRSPRGQRSLNPSCPPGLMQCISLLLAVFVRLSGRFITSDPGAPLPRHHPPYLPSCPVSAAILSCLVQQQGHDKFPSIFCLWLQTSVISSYGTCEVI